MVKFTSLGRPGAWRSGAATNNRYLMGAQHAAAQFEQEMLHFVSDVGQLAIVALSEFAPDFDLYRECSNKREFSCGVIVADVLPATKFTKKPLKRWLKSDACNSFVPGTHVLLADGSSAPIEDLEVGDRVLATDPETGESTVRTVTAEISGTGLKTLVEITTTDTDGETHTLTATDGHPFWVPDARTWTDARDLTTGNTLHAPDGTTLHITALTHHTTPTTVHNLTIADTHTYYVLAGETPVLVHNSNCPTASKYEDITSPGARMLNKSTDVGPVDFGKNLEANGWARTDKGPNIMYEKDGARYFLRGKANSHEGWTADYYNPGSKKADIKIRLGED